MTKSGINSGGFQEIGLIYDPGSELLNVYADSVPISGFGLSEVHGDLVKGFLECQAYLC
jgi:hypothetical protein